MVLLRTEAVSDGKKSSSGARLLSRIVVLGPAICSTNGITLAINFAWSSAGTKLIGRAGLIQREIYEKQSLLDSLILANADERLQKNLEESSQDPWRIEYLRRRANTMVAFSKRLANTIELHLSPRDLLALTLGESPVDSRVSNANREDDE